MLEILRFIFSGFWIFWGTVVLIYVTGTSVGMVAAGVFVGCQNKGQEVKEQHIPAVLDGAEDDMTKYECFICGKQFILGDRAAADCSPGYPVCPYCGRHNIDGTVMAEAGEIDDMGCMAIWTAI